MISHSLLHPLNNSFRRNRVRKMTGNCVLLLQADNKTPNTEYSIISTFNCQLKQNLGSEDTTW